MQLTGKDIEKQCNRARLVRGRALYASKAVEQLKVYKSIENVREYLKNKGYETELCRLPEDSDECSIIVATADVVGSTGNYYHVELVIDYEEEDKFLRVSCDCPDFLGGTPFCKHCVAVAHNLVMDEIQAQFADKLITGRELERQQQLKKQEKGGSRRKPVTHLNSIYAVSNDTVYMGRQSSAVVGQLISAYSGKNQSMWSPAERDVITKPGSIELLPNLVVGESGKQSLEFKIGTGKRYYVVKDILELNDNVKHEKVHTYGVNLEFLHSLDAFTQEARFYLNLISDIYSAREQHRLMYSQQSERYLRITDGYVEQIVMRNIGKTLSINGSNYEVVKKNPKLTLLLKQEEQGAVLSMKDAVLLKGVTYSFYAEEQSRILYILSEDFARTVVPFIQMLKTSWDMEYRSLSRSNHVLRCFLNERDYTAFCGHVLRKLERFVRIEEQDVDVLDSMPAHCQIHIYLDEPSPEEVTCRLKAVYGKEEYDICDWTKRQEGDFRDYEQEDKVYWLAKEYFKEHIRKDNEVLLVCNTEQDIYELLTKGRYELEQCGQVYVSERIRSISIKKTPKVTAGVQIQGDLLSLHVEIPDMSSDEIGEILSAYRMKQKYYRMKNGDFMQLDEAGFSTLSEMGEGLGIEDDDWKRGEVQLPLYRASYVDAVFKERGQNMTVVRSSRFKSVIRDMREIEDSDYELPDSITAELRGYQKTGYRWLRTLSHYGFGGILADDMGLGKTLQVLTLLCAAMKEESYDREKCTSLIVCPASLVYNWESEFHKFAPYCKVLVQVGAAPKRKDNLQHLSDVDVLITSYDLLKRDLNLYESLSFLYMIIDEAQYIKNAATQVARAVKKITAAHRFALTGTPVENRLSDLWSIFDFLMKGYLYSYEKFRSNYEQPVVAEQDEEALQRLQRLVSPFILRRRKREVLKDLPDKIEQELYMSMTDKQEQYYQARFMKLRHNLLSTSESQFKKDKLKVLAEITRLRQICCDPALFVEDYEGGSGKVDAFLSMAEELVAGGSNILVFSQFASMLEILEKHLIKLGISTLLLTGKSSKEERREMVEEFQNGQATVFLISLKAGGTGLNLTAADTVIHFDPWWNVAVQNQATDRAHRIGQDKVVTVIQMVMKNSIEERIIELQKKKKELVEHVVEADAVSDAALSKEEILGLLEEF